MKTKEKPSNWAKPFTLGGLLALEENHKARIETDGIYAYGYGSVCVCSISDKRLSICDKGVLAYLSSYCGDGGVCTCQQKTILRALRITDHTLSASMNRLIQCGYVIRERSFKRGKFGHYCYGVVKNPDKRNGWLNIPYYTPGGVDVSFHAPADRYGAVSKLIMNDQRLTVKEKGFYAALCSLGGKDHHIICHRDILAELLQICPDTASRYTAKLINLGLIYRENTLSFRQGKGPSAYTVIIRPAFVPYPKAFQYQDKQKISQSCKEERVDIDAVNSILGRTLGKVISPFQSIALAQQSREMTEEEGSSITLSVPAASSREHTDAAAEVLSKISAPAQLENLEVLNGRTRFIVPNTPETAADDAIRKLHACALTEYQKHSLKLLAYNGIPTDYVDKKNFGRLKVAVAQCFERITVSSNEDANILREIIKSVTYLSSERRPVVINGQRNDPRRFLVHFNHLLSSFRLPPMVEEIIEKIKRAIYARGVRYLSAYINRCVCDMVSAPI